MKLKKYIYEKQKKSSQINPTDCNPCHKNVLKEGKQKHEKTIVIKSINERLREI